MDGCNTIQSVMGQAVRCLMDGQGVTDILQSFKVCGSMVDDPEGSRYVVVSETLWQHTIGVVESIRRLGFEAYERLAEIERERAKEAAR